MSSPLLPSRGRRSWRSSPTVRVGLPFLAFIGLGTWLLSSFLEDQFEQKRRQQMWDDTETELRSLASPSSSSSSPTRDAAGRPLKGTDQRPKKEPQPEFDLQSEYQTIMDKVDLDRWENVRVPRPDQIRERTLNRAAAAGGDTQPIHNDTAAPSR